MLFDAHSHVQEIGKFEKDKVIPAVIGYSHEANRLAVEFAKKYNLPYGLGIAPQIAQKNYDIKWEEFIYNSNPNVIGEIGLDYYWGNNKEKIDKQKYVFRRMLEISEEMRKNIVIHCRDAYEDLINIVKDYSNSVMFHFFNGDIEKVINNMETDFYIYIIGLRSKKRKKAIKKIELENILIETDSPYVFKKPCDVIKSAEYVAQIKNIDVKIVVEETYKNARKFFGW